MNLQLRSLVAIVVMLSGCHSGHEVTSYQAAAAAPDAVGQAPPNSSISTTTTTTAPPPNASTTQSVPVEPPPSVAPQPNSANANRTTPPSSSTSSNQLAFPTAKPVEGKAGYVYSPFDPAKYVDVSGYAPGSKVKDPYSGKIFLVP